MKNIGYTKRRRIFKPSLDDTVCSDAVAKALASILKTINPPPALDLYQKTREMGRSRRKYKQSRPKVKVGLPKKNPNVFKPSFHIPPKLRSLVEEKQSKWDDKASVISNYKSFGVVSNPNLLGVRSRTSHIVECDTLNVPPSPPSPPPSDDPADLSAKEFEPIDCGSDLEEDGNSFFLSMSLFLLWVEFATWEFICREFPFYPL